ncbi:MAG: ribose 5-phosphate isomerase A [Longimicrobiales bacterium]
MALSAEQLKRAAAERAVELVQSGMRLGLGTGSTAKHVLDVIAERMRDGSLNDVVGVPTSTATADYARTLAIPLTTLDDQPHLDLAIDGADEVDPSLQLIKGLGGALLWEKIVENAADRLVIVVDESKLVARLGVRTALPVEVVPFGWRTHLEFFRDLGAEPALRTVESGEPLVTDGGHYIVDCRFHNGIADPIELEAEMAARVGVVECGLFVNMASDVIVAGDEVRMMSR